MTDTRQQVTIEEIKDRLLAQIDSVVDRYAPAAPGAYHKGALYFTLNPGRADRNVGSFCVHMSGPKAGRWIDYAVGGPEGRGDLIDLIGLYSGIISPAEKIREARRFLGLDTEDPATRRQRDDHARRLRAEREAKDRDRAAELQKVQKRAEGLFLSAKPGLRGTPVDYYLRGRGIDLSKVGHAPGAIRFHPECWFVPEVREETEDPETGEVITRVERGKPIKVPAMLSAIALKGRIIAVHRTYLAQVGGAWVKNTALPGLPKGKWVSNDYTGGCVRLSNGLGPRGGKAAPLSQCAPGTKLLIAEGIENGLSAIMLRALAGLEPMRTIATCMAWNMSQVELPEAVSEVVLAADNDLHPQARAMLDRAVAAHQAAGRVVRVWRSEVPGEDMNDALKRALREQEGAA